MKKRIFSLLLALCLVAGMLPTVAYAYDNSYGSTIDSGTFDEEVNNRGTINGGTFNKAVTNSGTIDNGEFNNTVTNTPGSYINNGTFNGIVYSRGGGKITGGTFNNTVNNDSASDYILGGTFNGTVNNNSGATIQGGTFNGTVNNNSLSKIQDGTFYSTVNNNADSYITGGTFYDKVTNGYQISGGTFYGDVENNKTITGGTFYGTITGSGTVSGVTYRRIVTFDSNGGSEVLSQDILKDSTATEPADPTKAGYSFDGWYNGDDPYDFRTPVTENITLTAKWVEKITLTADNYADYIDLTVPTGEVYLAEGGYNYPSATGKSGAAAVPTGAITLSYMDSVGIDVTGEPTGVGEYSVFLSVAEDENFNEASVIDTGKTYKIDKATPSMGISYDKAKYGSDTVITVNIRAKLKGDGTEEIISGGTVTLTFEENGVIDNSKTQTKDVNGASLKFTVTNLPNAGTPCNCTLTYSGNDNYQAKVAKGSFVVGQASSTTAVTFDKTSYTYGEDMLIMVDAPQAADETEISVIDIYDASANISFVEKNSDGKYVYKYTMPNGGDRKIKAEYLGSTNYSSSSETKTVTVEKLLLDVTVTPSASSYQYQDEVKLKLSVTGVPTGGSTSIRDFSIGVKNGDNIVSSMFVSDVVPFTDKEISLGTALGAGTYDIYVALDDDNYTVPMGEIMKSVTVARRAPVFSDFYYWCDFINGTYDKTEKTVTITPKAAVAADMGTVTVEYRRGDEIVTAPVDAGWYNVYVCVDDSGPNIKAGTVEIVGYGITKKTPDVSDMTVKINDEAPLSEYPYTGKPVTATVTSADEGAFGVTAVSYYKKNSEGNFVLMSEAPTDGGSYKVKVTTAESTNYSAATDVEVAAFEIKKADPDITFTNSGAVYYYDSAITVAGGVYPKLSIYDTAKRPTGTLTAELIDTSDSSSKVLPADKVNFLEEYGSYDVTFEPKTDFSAGKIYKLKLTYGGDENYNTATLTSGNYEIAKSNVIFEVSEKEHQYSPGEERGIKVQPKIGGMSEPRDVQNMPEGGIVVKYYAVDENDGKLASTTPVQKAIAPGRYLYVISLSSEASESYQCYDAEYAVTDTVIPDFAAYGNIGFMDIKSNNEAAQKPIYFDNAVVNAHMTDTVTNPLNNPNASTVTYKTSNEAVAEVDADTGTVTAKKPGTATITATSTKEGTTPVYASYTVTVRKELTIGDFAVNAEEKAYDGTDYVNVTAAVKTESLADSSDVVSVTAVAAFDEATAGVRTVSYEIVSISGKNADKYVLADNLTGTISGKITKAEVTIICSETTSRTYDGNALAVDVSAMANGRVFDSTNYTVKYNGEAAAVNVGSYPITVELNSDAAVNYEIKTQPNAVLVIKSASQEVFSIENVPDTVYYGDTFTVSTYGAAGDVTYSVSDNVDGKDIAAVDNSGNVAISGIGRVTITATSKKEGYIDRIAVKTFEVKKKILTPTATAEDRLYDGQNGVSVTVSLSGVLESDKDNVTATASGSMINADAGNEKIVYVSGITLSDDTNYTLSTQSLQTTVDIAPIEINGFTVTSENKTYDGTDAAQTAVTGINGVIEADKGLVSLIGTASYGSADVGEYNITYTATGLSGAKAGNYKLITTEYTTTETYKIEAVEIAFTIGQTSFVYDGKDKKITVSASDKFGRVFKDYTVSYFDGENNAVTPNKAGNYTARITLNSTNYTTSQADVAVTITEATQDQLVIAGLPGTVQYGDSFELEAYGGADGGEYKWEVVSGNADLSSDDAENTTVSVTGIGKVELKVTKKCSNYSDISVKTVFAASPKNITFEIGNLEQTYGSVTAVTVTPSDENVTYEITYDGNTELPENAGKYKVKVASTNENYSGNAAETLVINKGTASGSVNVNESYTYGDTVAATATGLTDGTTAEITYTGTGIYVPQLDAPKNAGSYTAIATITDANYETLTVTKEFKIEKAPLTVWASNAERAYGESNPIFTVEYDGFKYGEDKNVLLSEPIAAVNANASSPVGDYTITVSGGSAENYKFVYENTGKLTVTGTTGGQLVITGASNTVNVGQIFTLQAFYGNSKVNAAWKSDNTDVAAIDENGIVTALKAGTVNITATADENYSNATATFTITVKQSNITLVPTELVKTYNGARQDISFAPNADFTPILSGEGKNVEVKYTLISDPSVTEPIQVGTYSVVYTIKDESFTGGGNTTMYINKATVKAKVKDDSKVYGNEYTNYDLEITDNGGLVDAVHTATLEELKAFTAYASEGAAKTAAVKDGGYEIIPTLSQTETDNIKFSVEKGTLTVTKAPLTITVKNVSREYGAENPALEVEYEGFKNDETADVLTGELALAYDESINAETAVGSYSGKTTAKGLASDNYEITFVPGNVMVTKIGVKASAGTARSSYLTVKLDKAVPGLTANNFVVKNGDENITLTDVTASSDNKTYILKGSFSTAVTYTVAINLAGTESDATHEIISDALSIKPSSGSTGGGGGGSSTATTYTVTFETNGGNKIDSVKVSKNSTLSKPTEPTKDGYTFDGWYSDKKFTTAYDFTSKVTKSFTLYAKWTKKETEHDKPTEPTEPTEPTTPEWKNPFTDVFEKDWFYSNVKYANENGLMGGMTNTTFAPNEPLTRGMLVAILYRADGEPAVNKSIPFSDVDANVYYTSAVVWAQQNGIENGVTENAFAPDDNITREQIAAIMFRYAKYKGYDVSVGENTNILSYTDAESISEYAISAMQYAVGSGLMKGKTESTINPLDNATRAEIAAILQRFIEANK